ncbi:MAG: hypothetical protein HZB53_01835 [Chloroflexi bacterium]|nr:hypothetical protein [Chloroflexota bacterium]
MPETPDAAVHPLPLKRVAAAEEIRRGAAGFVGRTRELETLSQLVLGDGPAPRWLSFVGAAGIGRTRLAQRLASDWLAAFPDGAGWLDVSQVPDAALLSGAVAHALGMREQPGQTALEALAASLQNARILLVLDACDHLRPAVDALIARLLSACLYLSVIVTADEPLLGSSEIVWRVPALVCPDDDVPPRLLAQHDASLWFIECAARRGFNVPLAVKPSVALAHLCRLLDGVPLAIELAAAGLPAMPLADLAQSIDERFKGMARGHLSTVPRPQILRVMIDWSINRLSPDERVWLIRFSAFPGDCGLDALARLGPASETGVELLPGVLARLVDTALVVKRESDAAPCWRLIDPVRHELRERLRQSGDEDAVMQRAAAFYAELGATLQAAWHSPEAATALARARRELPNIRALLAWACAAPERTPFGWPLASVLGWFWDAEGLFTEARFWCSALLRAGTTEPGPWSARLLHMTGRFARAQADGDAAKRLLEQSVEVFRALPDAGAEAVALADWARATADDQALVRLDAALDLARSGGLVRETAAVLVARGDLLSAACPADAATAYQSAALTSRQLGDSVQLLDALIGLCRLRLSAGDLDGAHDCLVECLTLARNLNHGHRLARVLSLAGQLASLTADSTHAACLYADAAALLRELGARDGLARVLRAEGTARLAAGEPGRAASLFRDSLSLLAAMNDRREIAVTLAALACALAPQPAITLGAAARAILNASGGRLDPAGEASLQHALTTARAAVGDVVYQAAWQSGRAMTLADALALARMPAEQHRAARDDDAV